MTNDQCQMTKGQRAPSHSTPQQHLQMYHLIIHCRDEAHQRELFDRLRREGLRCRLTVL